MPEKKIEGPKVVFAGTFSFQEKPIKAYDWMSFAGKPESFVYGEDGYKLLAYDFLQSTLKFFSRDCAQKKSCELMDGHDVGVVFLYGYNHETKGKVVGVDLLLFRKTENWKDNPMVDSWTAELTLGTRKIIEYASEFRPELIQRENGIMCSAELRIAGLEAALRSKSQDLHEYESGFPVLPPDLVRREKETKVKVT
ncbi:MAG: hypothetical protein ABSD68_01625 [Candidatus Micrarchaeales archaeon]